MTHAQRQVFSATETPFPLQGVTSRMNPSDAEWMRRIRAGLHLPSTIVGTHPEVLAAYCFDLLARLLPTRDYASEMDQLQRFSAVSRKPLSDRTPEVIKEYLRPALVYAWCKESCVEWLQEQWTTGRPAIGQHIVTALFVQECLDGTLIHASMDNHGLYVWNELPLLVKNSTAGETYQLDLTEDQLSLGRRIVSVPAPLLRDDLLARKGVQESFDLFRGRMIHALIACGIAAASLAHTNHREPPDAAWPRISRNEVR